MTQPWPQWAHESFASVNKNDTPSTKDSLYYEQYNRLLHLLFPPETLYEIVPHFHHVEGVQLEQTTMDALLVQLNHRPVFFITVKAPSSLSVDSGRAEADAEMRRLFRDLRGNTAIPVLHGVSAFGTRMSFYNYDLTTHKVQPETLQPSLTDEGSDPQWDCDVLETEGAQRLKDTAQEVNKMCTQG